MTGMKYLRVNPNWHRMDTEHGTFFGHTRDQVLDKAIAAANRAAAAARFQEIADSEQAIHLAFTDTRTAC